jgi:DNA damage-binding protein 1
MRCIFLLLFKIARDFNSNWTTSIEMLNDSVFLGGDNWNNLFCLRRNTQAQSEEVRCRLDNIGEYHLGEMVNKFMRGSLVMPVTTNIKISSEKRRFASPQKKKKTSASPSNSTSKSGQARSIRRPVVVTGSQTLFGTIDGTLGVVLGLDGRTASFFGTLERALASVIRPVGDLSHHLYRACEAEGRVHPAHGFVDGDLVESFLDLDRSTMDAVVAAMNRDGGWELDDMVLLHGGEKKDASDESMEQIESGHMELTVDDVLAMVEEMAMLH